VATLMSTINAVLRLLFDGLLYPFRTLPPLVGLVIVSLLASIGMLLAFKATSNQERLADVKRHIHAGLFEIRLFNDDLAAIMRAQMSILRHNLTYLRFSMAPMIWIMPPLVLIIAQLQFHYGYRAFEPGETTLVTVELAENWQDHPAAAGSRPPVELQVPEGLRLETPAVWAPTINELVWRMAVDEKGSHELGVLFGDELYTKAVDATDPVKRRSPVRTARRFLDLLIYPAEPALPKGAPIESIAIVYPDAGEPIAGVPRWMAIFFVLSIVFAFALRNRLGVTI